MLIVSLEVSDPHSGANRKTYLIIVFLDDWNDCIWYKNVVNNDVKQSNTNNYWLTVWIICVGWPTISATIAFMFCKVFNDAALSPRHLVCQSMTSVRHNQGRQSPLNQGRALYHIKMALPSKTLSAACRQFSLLCRRFVGTTAVRSVHFSYVPDTPDPKHGTKFEC